MNNPFVATQPSTPVQDLHVGQTVHVNVRAAWLAAEVTSITHTRIAVTYHAGPRVLLADRVPAWLVRAAHGIRLQPVQKVCSGDDLVASDGTLHPLAGAWPAPGHRWVIGYTSGTQVTVPAHAILRLKDHTPHVTHNGIPLTSSALPPGNGFHDLNETGPRTPGSGPHGPRPGTAAFAPSPAPRP